MLKIMEFHTNRKLFAHPQIGALSISILDEMRANSLKLIG